MNADETQVIVRIRDKSTEPIQFDLYARGVGRPLKQKRQLYPRAQKCDRSILRSRSLYTTTPGEHTFQLDAIFDLTNEKKVYVQVNGHPGIAKMQDLARMFVRWPNIDKNIEPTVNTCNGCQSYGESPKKAPLLSWVLPDRPWTRLQVDFVVPAWEKCL